MVALPTDRFRKIPVGFALLALTTFGGRSRAQEDSTEGLQFFEKYIRPGLVRECFSCHLPMSDEMEGGLAPDARDGIRKDEDPGAAVVAGNVWQSLLIEATRHANDNPRMPPEEKL